MAVCARPIHLSGVDGFGREHRVFVRCKDRRGGTRVHDAGDPVLYL